MIILRIKERNRGSKREEKSLHKKKTEAESHHKQTNKQTKREERLKKTQGKRDSSQKNREQIVNKKSKTNKEEDLPPK